MKYTKALIITVLISTMSCKKTDYTFSTSEITETDINGNLTGNINQNDWKLLPLSAASEFDRNVFRQLNIGSLPFDYTKFESCDSIYNFSLVTYPNPLTGANCMLYFNFETDIDFKEVQLIIALRSGKVVMSGGNTDQILPSQYGIPALVKKDFICYYLFVTHNNCLYFGKGNVIGC